MIYTKLTKKAIKIAFKAHKDVKSQDGLPYICHPLHLAEQMTTEYETCAALLHDVLEDSDMTEKDLSDFPEEVIKALKLLTHDNRIAYDVYIKHLKSNPIAKAVKIADLKHNLDTSRLDRITPKVLKRNAKYRHALEILEHEGE